MLFLHKYLHFLKFISGNSKKNKNQDTCSNKSEKQYDKKLANMIKTHLTNTE